MADELQSKSGDMVDAIRGASTGDRGTTIEARLSDIEAEHRALSARRRRLHESIDMLARLDALPRDATVWLEKYRLQEEKISRLRQELYRQILALRVDHDPSDEPHPRADSTWRLPN